MAAYAAETGERIFVKDILGVMRYFISIFPLAVNIFFNYSSNNFMCYCNKSSSVSLISTVLCLFVG